MVDDHIAHHVDLLRQRAQVLPVAQARVNLGVVDGVKTGVGAIDGIKKRQQVHATKHPGQRAGGVCKQRGQFTQTALSQAIDIGD